MCNNTYPYTQGKANASKDGAALLDQHSQATGHGGGGPTVRDTWIQPMEAALNQTTFLTQGTGTVRQSDRREYNPTKRRG